MIETEKKPIVVTAAVYAKIKEWNEQHTWVDGKCACYAVQGTPSEQEPCWIGRVVNRFVCQHLGCLTEFFSPNPVCGCPNHAWACPGSIETANIKTADCKVEAVIAQPVKFKDLTVSWRESNQMSIVLDIPGHWRPVKAMSFGYLGGLMGMDEAEYKGIKKEFGRKSPSKWLEQAREDGSLEEILNRFGFTLDKKEKVLED